MTSKKSRVLMSLGTSVLVLSLITSSLVGGTFAKYTSTVAGSDSARVAKFDFTVKDKQDHVLKKDGSQTIDLFATVLDKGIYNDGTNNVNGSDDLVAPGTQGTFGLLVENKSEVAVKANLAITETEADGTTKNTKVPIIYAYTDADNKTTFWSDVIAKDTNSILLHELDTAEVSDISTIMGANSVAEAAAADFTAAQAGQKAVTISGTLKDLTDKINGDTATQLAPTNGSTVTADAKLDLGTRFNWFWAYEIYTEEEDPTSSGNKIWVPDTRDDTDTALVWDAASNAAQSTIPQIKVKIEVQITQMDTYTPPSPVPTP